MSQAGKRILLIDDDDPLGRTMSLLLTRAGYPCDHAIDSTVAFSLFRDRAYHVVITDINMPDGDGIVLVRELLKERRIPVIVISGSPTVQSALAAMQISVIAFLVKPFPIEALIVEVERGLAAEQLISSVTANLGRIEAWRAELSAFETLLKSSARPNDAAATLVALTARHLMEGMADLRVQIAALTSAHTEPNLAAVAALNATKPVAMLEAIRDTIAVLDRTKHAFRSRELGELRKRLEMLLLEEKAGNLPQV